MCNSQFTFFLMGISIGLFLGICLMDFLRRLENRI